MRNPAVDAYIAKSAGFAQLILREVRTALAFNESGERLGQALAWLAAGKPLHWKHQDC